MPSLRDLIDAAIRPTMLIGLQNAELHGAHGQERVGEWVDWISRQMAELVQPEIDRLRAELATARDQVLTEAAEMLQQATAPAHQTDGLDTAADLLLAARTTTS